MTFFEQTKTIWTFYADEERIHKKMPENTTY